VPRVRTELARRAFSVAAPQTWNSLPADIRSCHTLQTFKRHLKNPPVPTLLAGATSASVSSKDAMALYKCCIIIIILLGPFHGAIAAPLSRVVVVVVVVVVDIDAQTARDSTASEIW